MSSEPRLQNPPPPILPPEVGILRHNDGSTAASTNLSAEKVSKIKPTTIKIDARHIYLWTCYTTPLSRIALFINLFLLGVT